MGIENNDYHRLIYKQSSHLNAYNGTGTSISITAKRITYLVQDGDRILAIIRGSAVNQGWK
ncbi:MAG: hypothetical protein WBV73_00155 [Phormidium sp.]